MNSSVMNPSSFYCCSRLISKKKLDKCQTSNKKKDSINYSSTSSPPHTINSIIHYSLNYQLSSAGFIDQIKKKKKKFSGKKDRNKCKTTTTTTIDQVQLKKQNIYNFIKFPYSNIFFSLPIIIFFFFLFIFLELFFKMNTF